MFSFFTWLNPIENFWLLVKQEMYSEGKQSTSLNSVWDAVVVAAQKVDCEQMKKVTLWMEGLWLIKKKGGYTGHWVYYSHFNRWK